MKQATITINGTEYTLPKINYRAIIRLEDLGFDVQTASSKLFKTYAALVALTADVDLDEAADLIEAHCENGGKIDDLAVLMDHVASSDFFIKLMGSKTANKAE